MQKKKHSLSIKKETFMISFIFLTLVSLIFSCFFSWILYNESMDNAKNSLRECNNKILTYTEGIFSESASIIDILSDNTRVINGGNGDDADILSIYDTISGRNENITYLYSGYKNGKLCINNYPVPDGFDPTERPWYKAAESAEGVSRIVYPDAANGEWLFSHCKKLVDAQGEMTGVLCVDSSSEIISNQLSTKYQYDSQRSYIINPEGVVIAHPEEKYINDVLTNYMDCDTWNDIINGLSNYGEYKKAGIHSMAYLERIPNTEFIVVTAINASEVITPIMYSVLSLMAVMIFISIMLGIILSRLLIYRFANPVMKLKSRIENVALGKTENAQDLKFSNSEINDIANSIEIIVKDIAQREEEYRAAEYLSFHDSMTGLKNRRFLGEEQQKLDRENKYPICVICCDVNGLKLINDVFGHVVGDQLICKVADCLKKQCRAGDTVARIGGDEFILLMPSTREQEGEAVISQIKDNLKNENLFGAEVSASMGYAVKSNKEKTFDEVIGHADKLMYERKLTESVQMKQITVEKIIKTASDEGFIKELTDEELNIIEKMSKALCPDFKEVLKESYRYRNIGKSSVFKLNGSDGNIPERNSENGYRVLSALEQYREIAGYILHYTEHWDGTGWPSGLSGSDIPIVSRIIAVIDAFFESGKNIDAFEAEKSRYDSRVTSALREVLKAV